MLEKQPSPKKKQQRGIRSLNKMQQDIIRIMTQYTDGSPIEPKCVLLKWQNDYDVVARKKWRNMQFGGMMFQKICEKYYGDSSKNITFFLLSKNNLAKMLRWKQYLMYFRGSDMLSTSTMCRGVYHHWIGLGISHQMNETDSYNNIHSRSHSPQQQDERGGEKE
jgi:hypothetical protein